MHFTHENQFQSGSVAIIKYQNRPTAARIFLLVTEDSHQLSMGHDAGGAISRRSALMQSDAHILRRVRAPPQLGDERRSEEHTSELQARGPISYALFCFI